MAAHHDQPVQLVRRVLAELFGTAVLVAAVVGSGIMATRLSPEDIGLQLLENSIATAAVLVVLILALQPVSAAFNPVITLAEFALKELPARVAAALVAAQILGGIAGAIVANLMFDLRAVSWSTHDRGGSGQWLGEVVATAGLVFIVFAMLRSGRADRVAYGVAAWIGAAYWFTSSTSFANPAVTVARAFSDTFAGISPASVSGFVLMQFIGAAVGLVLAVQIFPLDHEPTQEEVLS